MAMAYTPGKIFSPRALALLHCHLTEPQALNLSGIDLAIMAMWSTHFALSSSFPLLNPHKPLDQLFMIRFDDQIRISNSLSDPPTSAGSRSWTRRRSSSPPVRASSLFDHRNSLKPSPIFARRSQDDIAIKTAASLSQGAEEAPKSVELAQKLQLGLLFGLSYLFNIYCNVFNKQVLKVYHFPATVTLVQFAVGALVVALMWTFNLYKRPKITGAQLAAIIPLAIAHTLGNLFTNMSLEQVSVSFTHTVKATEPFFTVILSAMILREMPTPWVVLPLMPIMGGVALASATEVSFNWSGFWSAMASNLTNQFRNVLSKKFMVTKEDSMDNITLFSIITIISFILIAPATVVMEGMKFTPTYMVASGLNAKQVISRSTLAAICFHAFQQISFLILERVSPVNLSVGNCVKRVTVIISSVIFFQTPVSFINSLGTGIALAGVFLYCRINHNEAKPKAA